MLAELDTYRYTSRTFTPIPYRNGNAWDVVAGCANAPVYQDIIGLRHAPPAHELRRLIRNHMDGGRKTVWYERALVLARARLRGERWVSAPTLPPDWAVPAADSPREPILDNDAAWLDFAAQVDTLAADDARYWNGEA
jgi:hypothetical protein